MEQGADGGEDEQQGQGQGQMMELLATVIEAGGPTALKRQCLRYIEEHFDAIPDLRRLPGVVAQQVLEYMMKRRKGGSRTLNDVNVRKFLLHEGLQCIDLNSFWLMPDPFRGLHCPHLLHLDLNGSLHVGDEGVTAIARASPSLQHLNVKGNRISDAALFELAKHCPLLEALYVQCSAIKRASARGRKGRKSPSSASECAVPSTADQITNEGVRAIATGCQQLRSLPVFTILSTAPPAKPSQASSSSSSSPSSSPSPSFPFAPSFVPSVCTALRRLKLNFDGAPVLEPVPDRASAAAAHQPYRPPPSAAHQPCHMPSLQVLKLMKHNGLKSLPFLHPPRQPDLRRDGAEDSNNGNDEDEEEMADGYFPSPSPPPTHSSSPSPPNPPDQSLWDSDAPALFNPLPSLVSLRLASLPKLTDASILTALLPFADQLQALELRQLTKVTGPTLERLLDARRRTERAQYCAAVWGQRRDGGDVDDSQSAAVSTGQHTDIPQLRSLLIHHCQAAKSLDIELPTSLASLELSCLYWGRPPPTFATAGIGGRHGCGVYPWLKRIDFSMTYVSSAHLRAIAQLCPHVTELVLSDCHFILDSGLAELFPFAPAVSDDEGDDQTSAVMPLYEFLSTTHYSSFPLRPSLNASATTTPPATAPPETAEGEQYDDAPPPQLRLLTLSLAKCHRISAPKICSPYLTKLDLSWSRVTSLAGVRMPRLKTVDVTGCQWLDPDSFLVFLAHSPRLRSLWAMSPSALDHEYVLDHLTTSPPSDAPSSATSSSPSSTSSSPSSSLIARLRVLNVSGLTAMQPRHVEAAIERSCRGLRTLHIGGCPHFSKALVDELERRFPRVLFKGWDRINSNSNSKTAATDDSRGA